MGARAAAREPEFLFRIEQRSGERRHRTPPIAISDLELASRLSFFLWSSIPDDELLDLAARGKLQGAGGARTAGAADAGRRPVAGAGDATSPGSGCSCAICRA